MMDTITGMRTFCAVANATSFVKAAKQLGISPALTSKYVGQLEERLGVRLLNRTTRSLALTENGRAYLSRAERLVLEFDELETTVTDCESSPRGKIILTAPKTFGETKLTQAIAPFLKQYQDIEVDLRLTDRYVDIIDEGFDLAIRVGSLKDSSLIARKLTPIKIFVCATPQYLKEHGVPKTPRDLENHWCIGDSNMESAYSWPFIIDGEKIMIKTNGRFSANSVSATRAMALADLGIVTCPDHVVEADVKAGRLVLLLEDYTAFDLGLYALYPHNRHLPVKVRVFIDFLAQWFAKK